MCIQEEKESPLRVEENQAVLGTAAPLQSQLSEGEAEDWVYGQNGLHGETQF